MKVYIYFIADGYDSLFWLMRRSIRGLFKRWQSPLEVLFWLIVLPFVPITAIADTIRQRKNKGG